MSKQTFGQRLKAAREAKGMPRYKLAARCPLLFRGAWEVERLEESSDDPHMPDLRRGDIVWLCQVLNTTPNYLLGFEEPV